MFEIKNVKYKDILYVDDLTIEDRGITCIVGKSGGGKTTFLKLLNNMLEHDTGTIKFNSKDIMEYDPVQLRRKVPMLPQNPVIFPGTIKENFTITQQYAEKEDKSEQDYLNILKTVGLDKHSLDEDAENLSGGEKQRIALARLLLLDPEILLLDEPSSALDEETEKLIIEMVVNYIRAKNGTLVMVTHSTKIAEQYGDRIVTINDGRVAQTYSIEGGKE